jgi:multidrug resistance efflux pump
MRWSGWRLRALAGLPLLLLGAAGARYASSLANRGIASFAGLGGEDVASVEVRPGRFVREVAATGIFKAVRATPIIVPTEVQREQKIAFIAADGVVLRTGDPVVIFDPYEADKEAADGRADLAAARAKMDKATAEGTRNERGLVLDRDVAKDGLDRAQTFQLADESLFSRHAIIESRLDKDLYQARTDVAGRKLETSGRLSAAEKALGQIEAGKAQFKVENAEKSLRALRVVAPHDGLLVLERNWRGETTFVGDSVWPGQKIAEIPDLARLEAKVFVLEVDAAGLKSGLSARVAIEGRPGSDYAATVARVEALAKTRERQSPVKYFEATLSLERTDPAVMKPGQRVRAVIRLEEQEGVLAIPRGALFEKDGKRVVYRREGGRFVPAEVTVSAHGMARVVIATGLRSGDRIALRDPAEKAGQVFAPAAKEGGEAPR